MVVDATSHLRILLLLLGVLAYEAKDLIVEVLHAAYELVPVDFLIFMSLRDLLRLYLFLESLTFQEKVTQFLQYRTIFLSVL